MNKQLCGIGVGKRGRWSIVKKRAVPIAVALMALQPAHALADCQLIGNLTASFSDSTVGGMSNTAGPFAINLLAGNFVTFSVLVTAGSGTVTISQPDGPGAPATVGTLTGSGDLTFTAPSDGTYGFLYVLDGGAGDTISANFSGACQVTAPPPAPPPTNVMQPNTPPSSMASMIPAYTFITDSQARMLDQGRFSHRPGEMPVPLGIDIADLQKQLDAARRLKAQLERNLASIRASTSTPDPQSIQFLQDSIGNAEREIERIEGKLGGASAATQFLAGNPDGNGNSTMQVPFETPQTIAAFATPDPATFALSGSDSGFRGMSIGSAGHIDIWSRVKVTIIDGASDNEGTTGAFELGVVGHVTDQVVAGGYLSSFVGRVESNSLASRTSARGFGGGIYFLYDVYDDLEAGLSVYYERSANDIRINAVTGEYDRDLFSVDASLTKDFFVGLTDVSVGGILNWTHSDRDAYTNSMAMLIPGTRSDQVTATAKLEVSRDYFIDSDAIVSVTPSVGVLVNGHLSKLNDITLPNGTVVSESSVTGDLQFGLTTLFTNGAKAHVGLGVSGIGGSSQGYSANARLRIPFN